MNRLRQRKTRLGMSLLDVAIGSFLLAMILIPSARLLRHHDRLQRNRQWQETILFETEQLIERAKIDTADPARFAAARNRARPTVQTVKLHPGDGPPLVGRLTLSADTTVAPSVPLLTIDCTVWHDRNGNGRPDSDEPSETLRTQRSQP